jgi:uncharacterized membrane protein YidH (DUF202 family)
MKRLILMLALTAGLIAALGFVKFQQIRRRSRRAAYRPAQR